MGGDNGVFTFSGNVTLKTSGSKTVTATDTGTGTITGTSPAITVAPAATDHLTVTTTAGSPQTAGIAFSTTVTAKDTYGNTTPAYTGTVALTSTDAQAVLPANYTFLAGDNGAHAFATTALKTVGSKTITATDTVTATITGTTPAVTVAPAALAGFAFSLAGPQVNGLALTGLNTLTAQDAFGNTVTSFNSFGDNVTITRNAPLTGTVSGLHASNVLNNAADFVNGVADLGSLGMIYTGNAATGTFTATAQTAQTGTSNAIAMNPGAATKLVLAGSPTQTAGTAQTLTITAQDASGNTATGYTGDKTLTLSGASLAGATPPTVTDKTGAAVALGTGATITFTNGVATAGGSLRLYKAESVTISATDGTLSTTGSDRLPVTVGPATASSLDLSATTTTPTAG